MKVSLKLLVTSSSSGATVSVDIPIGEELLPFGAANSGVEFDPLSAGVTTITASAANFTSHSQDVTVTD